MSIHLNALNNPWTLDDALARASDILGIHIPRHNFTQDSTNIENPILSIQELWLRVHPKGVAKLATSLADIQNISAEQVALKINDDRSIQLIRGIQENNYLVVENADRSQVKIELTSHLLEQSKLVILSVEPESDEFLTQHKPKSASDWFKYLFNKKRPQLKDAVIGTFIMNTLALGTAMYSMQIYDRVIPSQSNATLIVLTIGTLIAISSEYLMKQLRAKLVDKTFKDVDSELSSIFFNKALSIRLDARPKNVGTFISELRQFESIRGFMTSATLFILADAPFAIFFAFVMMTIGGILGLIPLVFMCIMLILGYRYSLSLKSTNEQLVEQGNRKNGLLIEAMDGIESIKAVGGESQLLKSWQGIVRDQAIRELHHKETVISSANMASSVQQLAYIFTVAVGAWMIHQNQLTTGGLIGCTILSGRILGPLAQIPQLLVQWGQIKHSLLSLDRIMSLPSDTDNHENSITPDHLEAHLSLENIKFSYDKDQKQLSINHLKFSAGNIIVVMGRVGSGKSTLLKILSGLYRAQEGKVLLSNIEMTQLPSGLIREKIGYLPQDVRLIKGSLKDNLTLGLPYIADSEILAACKKTGLDRLISKHPQGMALPISEGGLGLSGGQRQMVALTRLLLAKPSILLLDEPTASLDTDLENHVLNEIFKNMTKDTLIVIVSHKPAVLRFATHVMIMENNELVQFGPKDLILNNLKEAAQKRQLSQSK